jgi:hypothetical protein
MKLKIDEKVLGCESGAQVGTVLLMRKTIGKKSGADVLLKGWSCQIVDRFYFRI